ncbi:hypothetical protein IBE10_05435 [Francisella tularensis subsp. novicida]|uniref:hypothetical protein n=1 Tax=Francisella tularensis TaxID=263 RepID=UPI0008FD54CE|nr:hypothetical protein [Francisella tularensis]APC94750.1 hypothetical protein KX02_624 [Francisella tularensis subsp. novicida]MBK2346365.1 hypothetical protein [Francisella tularensis subsp. novicida]
MQRLELKVSPRYRNIIYASLVFISSFVIASYFGNTIIGYFGFLLILVSLFFVIIEGKFSLEAIIIPNQLESTSLIFVINGSETDFWLIRKHIVINGWIFLYAIQQGSNKKIKMWLHKSNFQQHNDIKALARYILFNQNN